MEELVEILPESDDESPSPTPSKSLPWKYSDDRGWKSDATLKVYPCSTRLAPTLNRGGEGTGAIVRSHPQANMGGVDKRDGG